MTAPPLVVKNNNQANNGVNDDNYTYNGDDDGVAQNIEDIFLPILQIIEADAEEHGGGEAAKEFTKKRVQFDDKLPGNDDESGESEYQGSEGEDIEVDARDTIVPSWLDRPHLMDNQDLLYFIGMFQNEKLPLPGCATDGGILFNPDNADGGSKGDFAQNIGQWQAKHSMSDDAVIDILLLIAKAVPGLRHLFTVIKKPGMKDRFRLELKKYLAAKKRRVKIHVCERGCMGYFTGNTDIYCRTCTLPRLLPCTQAKCNSVESEACDPWDGGCHINCRIAGRAAWLRPFIPLFEELLEMSALKKNKVFDYATNYIAERTALYGDSPPMDDLLDSPNARRNMSEMDKDVFQPAYAADEIANPDLPRLVQRSFIMSLAYDGGALFNRHNTTSVWPTVASILNCNPTNRNDTKVGLHKVGLHDMKVGMPAEEQLFSQCVVPELQKLGMGMVINSIDEDGNPIRVFLQARAILHILDTKAFEKVSNCQGEFWHRLYWFQHRFHAVCRSQCQMWLCVMQRYEGTESLELLPG